MPSRRNYSNSASVGTITDVLNNTDTTTNVTMQASLTSWPSTPCLAAINLDQPDEEIVLVTAISGTLVTLTRGYNGSVTRPHSANATFTHCSAAIDFDEANAHTTASTGVHGVAGSVVGTSDSQSLSNKTLVAPTVADFTNANHDHSSASKGGAVPQSSVSGLTTALAAKAADAAVIHTTGDETAAGNKTFSGNVTVSGASAVQNLSVGGTLDVTGTTTLPAGTKVGTKDVAIVVGGGKTKIQSGTINITITAGNTSAEATVTFPVAFTANPIVVATGWGNAATGHSISVTKNALTTTQVTFDVKTIDTPGGGDFVYPVDWIAIGS